jgi:hypothetical protein
MKPTERSLGCFFFTFVLPKRSFSNSVDKNISSQKIVKSLSPLFEEFARVKRRELGNIAFLAVDRFFDSRMAFRLELEKELESMFTDELDFKPELASALYQNKVNVFKSATFLDVIDYVDLNQHHYIKMDELAYYFILPVFILSSKPNVDLTQELFSIFPNKEIYNNTLFRMKQLIQNISNDSSNSYFCGLFESEALVSKYIIELKPQIA